MKFERIHPFQDGNGRVGRLIMFKECLKYNIVPFIIEDNLKLYYYRGLKEWNNERGYLTDTCLSAQDKYKAYLDYCEVCDKAWDEIGAYEKQLEEKYNSTISQLNSVEEQIEKCVTECKNSIAPHTQKRLVVLLLPLDSALRMLIAPCV